MADDEPMAESIAVCIRVRPLNARERKRKDAHVLRSVPMANAISLTDASGQPLPGKHNVFRYDHIYDEGSSTQHIYDHVAKRIVRSAMGGINGTIFAYGQTSSGKTFTMQGADSAAASSSGAASDPSDNESSSSPRATAGVSSEPLGILQLAVEDIFSYIENCVDRDFLLRVSYVEIYNEIIRDLLAPGDEGQNLKLREDPRKGVYVESKEEIITTYDDILHLLQVGNARRTVGHTAMNDRSSRSHSLFRIVIESKQKQVEDARRKSEDDVTGAVLVACLSLVDLAGSESVRNTAAEGLRQREAGNINKSLLTLSRVIHKLAAQGGGAHNSHGNASSNAVVVPFRDSKLTRLLQNSLDGNTRTLMICCVTPSERYLEETKSTLQFAARAKDIQTSVHVNEVLDDQAQLKRLKREVHELKRLVDQDALNAIKAEKEALMHERSHNKAELVRLMSLMLSSTTVSDHHQGIEHSSDSTNEYAERPRRTKRVRETWGPGDFAENLRSSKSRGRLLSPNPKPRKRVSAGDSNVQQSLEMSKLSLEATSNKSQENSDDGALDFDVTHCSGTCKCGAQSTIDDLTRQIEEAFQTVEDLKSINLGEVNELNGVINQLQKREHDLLVQLENIQSKRAEALKYDDEQRNMILAERDSYHQRAVDAEKNLERMAAKMCNLEQALEVHMKMQEDHLLPKAPSLGVQKQLFELEEINERLTPDHANSHDAMKELGQQLKQTAKYLSDLESQVISVNEEKTELAERLSLLKMQLETAQSDKTLVEDQLVTLQQRFDTLQQSSSSGNYLPSSDCSSESHDQIKRLEKLQAELDQSIAAQAEAKSRIIDYEQELAALRANNEELAGSNNHLQEVLDEETREKKDLMDSLRALEKQSWQQVNEPDKHALEIELHRLRLELHESATTQEQQRNKLAMDHAHAIDLLKKELHCLQESKQRLQSDLESTRQEHSACTRELDRCHTDIRRMSETVEALGEDKLAQHLQLLQNDNTQKSTSAGDQLAQDYERILKERDNLFEELSALEPLLMEESKEKSELYKQLHDTQSALTSVTDQMTALDQEVQELTERSAQLEQDAANASGHVGELEAANAALEERIANLQAMAKSIDNTNIGMEELSETESDARRKLELDVKSYEEALVLLRNELKDNSKIINGLTEKLRVMEQAADDSAHERQANEQDIKRLGIQLQHSNEEKEELRFQMKQRYASNDAQAMLYQVETLQQELKEVKNGFDVQCEQWENEATTKKKFWEEKESAQHETIQELQQQVLVAQERLEAQESTWLEKARSAEDQFAQLNSAIRNLKEEVTHHESKANESQEREKWIISELEEVKRSYADVLQEKGELEKELAATEIRWKTKEQEMSSRIAQEMEALRSQSQEAQQSLGEYESYAEGEIHRLRTIVEEKDAELRPLKEAVASTEALLQQQQEQRQHLEHEIATLHEEYSEACAEHQRLVKQTEGLEAAASDIDVLRQQQQESAARCEQAESAQNELSDQILSLKEIIEKREGEIFQQRNDLEELSESLKSAQMEATHYHNQLAVVEAAKESLTKLTETQQLRLEKLEKVKMTTETLNVFRKLKSDRDELTETVHQLKSELLAAKKTTASSSERNQRQQEELVVHKDEQIMQLKNQVQELSQELQAEAERSEAFQSECERTLCDMTDKSEQELQQMQSLLRDKGQELETLERRLEELQTQYEELTQHKSGRVAYLEKENLDLLVENRTLQKRLEVMGGSASASVSTSTTTPPGRSNVQLEPDESAAGSPVRAPPSGPNQHGFLVSNEATSTAALDADDAANPACKQQ